MSPEYIQAFKRKKLRAEDIPVRELIKQFIPTISIYENYDNYTKLVGLFMYFMTKGNTVNKFGVGTFSVHNHAIRTLFAKKTKRKETFETNNKRPFELDIMIKRMFECNIIEMVANYHIAETPRQLSHCRVYKFTDVFLEKMYNKNIFLSYDLIIADEIYNKQLNETELFLKNFLETNVRLNISNKKVIEILHKLHTEKGIQLSTLQIIKHNIDKFKNKNIWVSQDPKSGRIYSSFSSMKREFRKYVQIYYNGKWHNLKEIDIKCAQPLFLAGELKDKEFHNIVSDDIYKYLIKNQPNKIITYEYNPKTKTRDEIIIEDKLTRDEMKLYMMKFLFQTTIQKHEVVYQILDNCNKPILDKIVNIKKQQKEKKSNLAIKLQTIEANGFNPVYENNKLKSIPLCDAIYVIEEKTKDIKEELIKSFNKIKLNISDLNIHLN
ncbi:MAG: hypothetical protein RSE41_00200 [Clostridia bacterium]